MKRLLLIGLIPLVIAAPATAQSMPGMSGMKMPMPAAKPPAKPVTKRPVPKKPARRKAAPAAAKKPIPPKAPAMAGMPMEPAKPTGDMPAMPTPATDSTAPQQGMADMPGMDMKPGGQGDPGPSGMAMPEPEIPKTPPPPPPKDHAADRIYGPSAMTSARDLLRAEHGGGATFKIMANIAEFQPRSDGASGYRWDGQAWFGGDINRLVVKTEGEGDDSEGVGKAELQALYSRAVGPYLDVQAGLRQNFEPRGRTYATVGLQTLLPYWFEVEASAYLSTKGEFLGRVEGNYDLRLTQRLVLQPRVELNLAAQDTLETRTGSGLSDAEVGLRLRYEVRREFAPYIGITYDRKFGRTADFARAFGEDPESTRFVIGIRAWF